MSSRAITLACALVVAFYAAILVMQVGKPNGWPVDDLGRPITIRQGVGSELLVRPDPDPVSDAVEVGGRVELVEVRAFGQ